MKNSSDYGNGPPIEQEPTPTGYADSSSYRIIPNPSDSFYTEGFPNSQYSFVPYNQENNLNKLNINPNGSYRHHPYDRPNSQQSQSSSCNSVYLQNPTPSPSPNQCEKCGFIYDSIAQLTEHVNNCHPSTPLGNITNFQNYNMLSGGEIIKTEPQSEILDLDSYKVHQVLPEEENVHHQPQSSGMMQHQWGQAMSNQHIQPEMFDPNEQRMYLQQEVNQRIFSPSFQNVVPTQENVVSQQVFNVEQKLVVISNESPSPAKSTSWKSNEARKPKTYNCTACNKWFTSSGHLKRHYNTTLHKNAVKTSGQPDPANLPISIHHHPKGEQSRTVDKQPLPHSPMEESEEPRSSNEQYDLAMINHQSFDDPPNAQADPSVMEPRGLPSIHNHMLINSLTNSTFNNTINSGFLPHTLMPVDSALYQMHPNANAPHGSPVIITSDPTVIGNEEIKYTPLTSPLDNTQPLPSFSQIQRFGQMQYYGDVGGETIAYSPYNLNSFNSPQSMSYQEDEDRKYTLIAPPDSTSTDGDLLPIRSTVNNNNLIVNNEEPVIPNIKYDLHCSSPETSIGTQDVENSSPQISSTSNIVRPQPLHKCFDCDKVFNKSCYLTQHNKTFHSGDKPYKCIRCGKRFSGERQHLEHQAKHGGDKPHKCDQCPKQFNHKTDLRRHMCLHTGKKPFICDLCGKGFIRKDHMIKHGETHLKKPPKNVLLNNTLHARNQ